MRQVATCDRWLRATGGYVPLEASTVWRQVAPAGQVATAGESNRAIQRLKACPREQSHVGEVFRRPSRTHRIEHCQHVDPLLHNRPRYRR